MATYRILAIDGGGIRGLVTTILLERLGATPGLEDILERIDLVAGTSTGGLLALAIAREIPLAEIGRLYRERGPKIFDDSWLDDLVDVGKLRGADYRTGPLRRELRRLFGPETTLGDLRKRVLIPAFDLDNEDARPARRTWKPKLFHNFPGPGTDRRALAWGVGLYTSAAPTYFPSVDGYVDGGVYANNPSMCALGQALDRRYAPTPRLDEVVLLSLGTGTSLRYVRGRTHDWGYAQWAKPLVELMFEASQGIADYQCRQLLDARYHRLAPVFPPGVSIALDDVRRIPEMEAFARTLPIADTVAWLHHHWP